MNSVHEERMRSLLRRFDALRMPATKFERTFGLQNRCIASMRLGKYQSERSVELLDAFERALDATERGAVPNAPAVPQDRAMDRSGLMASIEAADTVDACLAMSKAVVRAMALPPEDPGHLPVALGRALTDAIKERRQLIDDKMAQEQMARAGEPIEVRIVYVNDWRRPS